MARHGRRPTIWNNSKSYRNPTASACLAEVAGRVDRIGGRIVARKRRPRRLINRYAQARLYDVTTGAYVCVDQLKVWRSEGFDVIVREVESGRYVTEAVLPSGFDA